MGQINISRNAIQSERILKLLRSARGAWIPLPEILALGVAQYNARIFELRKRGLNIQNRTETVDGVRHSWFRLVDGRTDQGREPLKAAIDSDRPPLTGLPLFDLGVRR
jgi:Helix-turn-helix domain